ncbi:zinc finger DHHC-type containing 8 [Dermatophagoides pteronyssinus]|uniref:zinc finger DHHC-type containing 8 n=1 Tax=Dermatophagoides pteronyssinus TaxID=6956 RepID=UPI003F661BC8
MSTCKSIKRLIPASCAWILLLTTTGLFFIYPCRRLHEEYHFSITIAQAIIAFYVISNLFATTFVDPGIIKRADSDEDKDDFRAPIYKEVQIKGHTVRMKWCSTCQFYRPPRCSHCSVCDNCIEKFDHHCPWVNNCIGRRNYRHFFFFLIFLTIHMITIFSWCLIFVINNRNNVNDTAVVVSITLIVIITIFFIPIVGLTGFHIVLVVRGRTTNEQVTRKFNRQINPFSNGFGYNFIFTVCGPRYPGLHTANHLKTTPKDSDIRIYMDNKPDNNEKKLDDLNFSVVDNPKDILLERFDDGPIGNTNNNNNNNPNLNQNQKRIVNESYQESSSLIRNQQQQHLNNRIQQQQSINRLGNNNGLKAEENHVVTMHHTENGTKETTFIALSSSSSSSNPNNNDSSNNKLSSSIFPNQYNNKISAKSLSINEKISANLMNKQQQQQQYSSPMKNDHPHHRFGGNINVNANGPEGGMLIYYSPDAGYNNNVNNFNSNNRYNSDTELQNFQSLPSSSTTQMKNNNGNFLQYIDDDDDSLDFGLNSTSSDNVTTKTKKYFKQPPPPSSSSSSKPMPFQKALDISNKIEHHHQQQQNKNNGANTGVVGRNQVENTVNNNSNRQSQYEMNYEISV